MPIILLKKVINIKKSLSHKSKKSKTIYKKFYIDIYHSTVHVLIGDNWNEHKLIKEVFEDEELHAYPGTAMSFADDEGYREYMVAFSSNPENSVIAHECVHLMFYISDQINLNITYENQEVGAYLLETLFKNIKKIAGKHIK